MQPETSITATHVLTIVGILVSFLQAVMIMILLGLKEDMKDIWDRIYNHYHEIECNSADCTAVRTGNVIIPHK